MASTVVQTSGDTAVSARDAADRLQGNLRLSMKSENSLPEMLMAAPFAINFLGQLRLLAFSDSALKISLEKPDKGFDYLKYPSLSSAMQQILQQASKAFSLANGNMQAIDMAMKALFGRSSYVRYNRTLLFEGLLADFMIGARNLGVPEKSRPCQAPIKAGMKSLQTGMNTCSEKAKDIKKEFDILVATLDELNLAMGHQMKTTESEKREADKELRRAEINDQIQKDLSHSLKQQYERFERDAEEATKRFNKTARAGEWKALGLKTVSDAEAGIAGLIHGAAGIVKEAPKFATQTVAAVGALGGATARFMSTGNLPVLDSANSQPAAANKPQQEEHYSSKSTQAYDLKIDPAIISIDRMESLVSQVHHAVHKDLLPIILNDGQNQELLDCSEHLKAYKSDLGDFRSQYVVKAKAMLDQVIRTADDILKSEKLAGSVRDADDERWQKKVENWRKDMTKAHGTAVYLKAVASTQAGQGFGDASLDIQVQAPADPNNSNIDMAGILNSRHRKLLIMRAAMQEAQRNLQQTTERYRETQREAIELASSLEHLKREKATMEDLKKFLRKAIDNVTRLQTEVCQLNEYFEFMSNTLSILLDTVTHRFLDNIESGISDKDVDFGLSYGQAQRNIIRQTVLSLRGQILFIIESTRLYQGISACYILPCMRMAANLPLEAPDQEQDNFTKDLKGFTNGCAEKILELATKELEKTSDQLNGGLIDVSKLEATIDGPAPPQYVEEAIGEGVKEAREQKQERTEELTNLKKEMEIGDDFLG